MSEEARRMLEEPITPPFWGAEVWLPPLEEVNPYLERMALLVGRWGYKKGNLSEGEYRRILEGEAQGHLERLLKENTRRKIFVPRAAVAWLRCRPQGDALTVFPVSGEPVVLAFPRQRIGEKRCIADYFARDGDAVGFFTVTVGGPEAAAFLERLRSQGEYQEYFFWNGFAAEYTDAVAEWTHRRMLEFLGGKQGARFGPGYPSCPDLTLVRWIWRWTEAWRIGVEVTETHMLAPEMSTSALVAPRRRAKVFNTLG